jgi:CheY-like chemotaxis protein
LGLSIAKHLVELHGGRIQAFSEGRGHGARFTVVLPVSGASQETRQPVLVQPASEANFADARVLVVDDDPDACELMVRLLMDAGARAESANSVDEALMKLRCEDFDVLLSDIGMPGRDGYELIREVRRCETSVRGIPAIAVTAFVRMEDRARAIEAGYNRHLSKPIDPGELMSALSSLLRAHARRG